MRSAALYSRHLYTRLYHMCHIYVYIVCAARQWVSMPRFALWSISEHTVQCLGINKGILELEVELGSFLSACDLP